MGWAVKIVFFLVSSSDYASVFGNQEFGQSFTVESSSYGTPTMQTHRLATLTVLLTHARLYDILVQLVEGHHNKEVICGS